MSNEMKADMTGITASKTTLALKSPARLFMRAVGVAGLVTVASATGAFADKIKNPTAVFSGLDKITGRIVSFDVAIDETVQFGTLQLTPRVCYSRPTTEAPQTDAFIEVDESGADKQTRRIFGGWVFAASPGLHGIEHPIYDIWLTACKGGTVIIPDEVVAPAPKPAPAAKAPTSRQQPQSNGQIGITPPSGVPVTPRVPTQRYLPPGAVESAPLDAPRPPGTVPLR